MKQIKRILTILIIVTLLIPTLCPFSGIANAISFTPTQVDDEYLGTRGLTKEQQNYVAKYVRVYLAEAHKMSPVPFVYDSEAGGYAKHYFQNEILTHCCPDHSEHEYTTSQLGQSGSTYYGTYSNRMRTVCCVFTASMLHQALGVDLYHIGSDGRPSINGAGIGDPNGTGKDYFNEVSPSEALQPGDIISYSDFSHSIIYIGPNPETGKHEWAQTNGLTTVVSISNVSGGYSTPYITLDMVNSARRGNEISLVAARLKPELVSGWSKPEVTKIQWPNGTVTTWQGELDDVSTETDPNAPLFYSGIATKIGSLGRTNPIRTFFEGFPDIIDYFIGILTSIIRIPFVGLTYATEMLVTQLATVVSTEPTEYSLTLEKIVYNQVPFLDINIFKNAEEGKETQNIISTLKTSIAQWHISFRNLVIAILLVVLIYLGLRMAITSIAEEKAHYKRMLVDWFVSFFLVLFIHYFIVIVFNINDTIVQFFYEQSQNASTESLYESARVLAHSAKFSEGWYGAILYIALVWFMVKYAWKYAKRVLSSFILIILSPLVAVSYALDKIKDNRSQSLSKWLKEIAFTGLIQSVHALIYTVFMVGVVSKISENTNVLEVIGSCVFLFIAVKFMDAAEDIFENIFGFKAASSLQEIMDSSFELFAKYKMVTSVAKKFYKTSWGLAKGVGKYGSKFVGGTVNLVTRDKWKGSFDNKIQEIKDAYKEARDGRQLSEEEKATVTGKAIIEQRSRREKRYKEIEAYANKKWASSVKAVTNIGKGMMTFMSNPRAGIVFMLAGGMGAYTTIKVRNIKGFHKDSFTTYSYTGEKKDRQEAEVLQGILIKELELKNLIDEEYSREDSLLVRRGRADATDEEKKQGRDLQKVIDFKLMQASKTIKKADLSKIIAKAIVDANHKGKKITIDLIIEIISKEHPDLKIDSREFKKNLENELKRAMLNKATGKEESIKVGFKDGIEVRDKFGERVLSDANVYSMRMSGHKDKQIEESIGEQIDEYFETDTQEKVDEILEQLDIDDIAHLMTRTINAEGSIERNYSFEYEPGTYSNAIKEALNDKDEGNEDMPNSLTELTEFTKRIETQMSGAEKNTIVSAFENNVRNELNVIKDVIQNNEKFNLISHIISESRLEQITEEIEDEEVKDEKIIDTILLRMTKEEKQQLFKAALTDNKTTELEEVLQRINYRDNEGIPNSLNELTKFAKKIDRHMPETKRNVIVPVFGKNVRDELKVIKDVIQNKERFGQISHIISENRVDQIAEEIEAKEVKDEKIMDTILLSMTKEEKQKLFESALTVNKTTEMEETLQRFEPILKQAIRLREEYANVVDRHNIEIQDLVKAIREGKKV